MLPDGGAQERQEAEGEEGTEFPVGRECWMCWDVHKPEGGKEEEGKGTLTGSCPLIPAEAYKNAIC